MTTLDVSTLQTFDRLYPQFIRKFETIIPQADQSIVDKINSIIEGLNDVGRLTNDVVKNWNTVMTWVMNDGLNQDVTAKIDKMFTDGTFNTLIDGYSTQIVNEFNTQLATTNANIQTASQNAQTQIDLINTNQVVKQTDYNTFVSQTDSSLVKMQSNKIYLEDYPRLAVETNDNGVFSRVFAAITDNTEVVFEKGKTYIISQGFTINKNNVFLNGNGSIIQSTTTIATNLFQTNGTAYKTVNNVNVLIGQRVNAITLPDVTGIGVGDFIMAYNSVVSGGYNTGILAEILSIDSVNKIIYVSHPSDTAFTADRISFYTSYSNILIQGFQFICTQYDIGVWLQFTKNSKVQYNLFTSNGGRVGINHNYSINGEVEHNYINGFRDDLNIDNKSGYGIHLGGHNMLATLNIIKDCKHCISAGEGLHTCSKIKYRDNTVYAGILNNHLLDFHNNCGGEIDNNYVYANNNQVAICTRCNNATIKNNKIVNDKNSTTYFKAIVIGSSSTESPTLDNIKIENNEVYGKVDELVQLIAGIAFSHIKIENNSTENGYINCLGSVNNGLIEKNRLKQNAQIVISSNSKDIMINKNEANGGNTEYDNVIAINTGCSDIRIAENTLSHQAAQGGVCIRTASPYTQIIHNTLLCDSSHQFNDVNAYNNHTIKDNMVYALDYSTAVGWTA